MLSPANSLYNIYIELTIFSKGIKEPLAKSNYYNYFFIIFNKKCK